MPRFHPPVRLLFALLALMGLGGGAFSQTVLYVDDGAPPGGNGLSWCTAFHDLQDALAAAQPQDLIKVAEGTYRPDRGTGDRTQSFHLEDAVSVLGGYAGCGAPDPEERDPGLHPTILSGFGGIHVVVVGPSVGPSTVLDGFTISGGDADGTSFPENCGGGIYCLGSPKLQGCTISGSRAAENGGGMWNGGNPVLEFCTFQDNRAALNSGTGGGGLFNAGGIFLAHCFFRGNRSEKNGGGLENQFGGIEILDCLFYDNLAMGGGGGSDNAGSVVFRHCRFEWNRTGFFDGGGAWEHAGSLYEDCVFHGNQAMNGGGVATASGKPVFRRCLFHDNVADDYHSGGMGGGLAVGGGSAQGDSLLEDCLFRENRAGGGGGFSGQGKLLNCIFGSNFTTGGPWANGGALMGRGVLINCTFVGNTAMDDGGGIDFSGTMTNCILWNNQDRNGTGESSQIQGNPIINNCLVMGWTGSLGGVGNFDADPMFVEESIGDYHLLATSPCIDAGDGGAFSTPPAVDFEGDPRPSFHGVDIGADEFHRHLYVTGDLVPGGLVTVKFIGRPGSFPVRLALGTGVLDPPRSTSRGDWYLSSIRSRKFLGPVPANGFLAYPRLLPPHSPENIPLQGQIGRWFTNLFEVEIQ